MASPGRRERGRVGGGEEQNTKTNIKASTIRILDMKYIVVTGGVISGLGKGITASSIGYLLKENGYHVTAVKIDPYLNIDAGTMSPYEHGEVYVLNDGTETDLDLGNYERFLGIELSGAHNITSGKVLKRVLDDERNGKYIGQTVQYVPHVTNTIIEMIKEAAHIPINHQTPYICIIELGGTIGDIESLHFVEALRQMNDNDMCFVHMSLLLDDEKTKPTQHSVQTLRSLGIFPDLMVLRTKTFISEKTKNKINLHCQTSNIFSNIDVKHVYEVPSILRNQGIHICLAKKLDLISYIHMEPNIMPKNSTTNMIFDQTIHVVIVGKYCDNKDTYLSIHRSLEHSAHYIEKNVVIDMISSDNDDWMALSKYDGVIIPGGFGDRGIEGMVEVARICRTTNKPMLGICLGMQIMCIESMRKIDPQCTSSEFDPTNANNVIISIDELDQTKMGGTMKLGVKETHIQHENSHAYRMYNSFSVFERHRHRYEVNPSYQELLEKDHLIVSGKDINNCIDIIEDTTHPFYFGCQYHPEYKNTLEKPSPVFIYFLNACDRIKN